MISAALCYPLTPKHYLHTCQTLYRCPSDNQTLVLTYVCMYVFRYNTASLLRLHSNLIVDDASHKLNQTLKLTDQCEQVNIQCQLLQTQQQ